MKIEINLKNSEHLPYKELSRSIDGATENDIKVLTLLLASTNENTVDTEAVRDEIVNILAISETEYESSVAYWRGAKVIKVYRQSKKQIESTPDEKKQQLPSKKLITEDKLPSYTEEQMSQIIEKEPTLQSVIDECQQIIGKVFPPADVSVIVGLSDRLGLSGEYITMFVAYCAGIGKKTLRYIERSACNLYDEGIDTSEKLAEYIRRKEDAHKKSIIIRRMTGCADRELSAKESGILKTWLEEYRYGTDIIRHAFDITADRGVKGSMLPYMNAILKAWYDQGLKTDKDVENMLEQFKKSKEESGSGFDTDDFFNKAVAKTQRKRNDKTEA